MKLLRPQRWSIRLRLAALLTALFLLLGATLLGVSYALVRSNLSHDRQHVETATDTGLHEAIPPAQRPAVLDQVRAAQDELVDDTLRDLTRQYLVVMVAMAMLSGALGWLVAGRVLRPISEITATARRVSQERLHERIALEGPEDELKRLADTFDAMLARLETAFDRQAAFVRNASHELRTPLSVIRTETDVALADEADDPEALRRSLGAVRQAGKRSERLVSALLTLAQVDRGDRGRSEVDLAQLVRELTDEIDLDGLRLELALAPRLRVTGDAELLRTMVANLIENAVRHNTAGGWIEVHAGAATRNVRLEISNSGAGITAEEAASLTEPFRRLATARTGDGLGLGLSIADLVAQAHGGELTIDPLDQGGLRVLIQLPTAGVS
jgi:signal transduction histidine kinase